MMLKLCTTIIMIAMRRSTIIRPEVEPHLGCVHRLTLLALVPLEAHQTRSLKLASKSWILGHFTFPPEKSKE